MKARILEDPDAVLEDREVMRALIAAGGGALGRNVVDLRGVLVERLENRLGRLQDTHRTVIAAAFENLAGTNQIHRGVLAILEPMDFSRFLSAVGQDLPGILSVDIVRIGIEAGALAPGTPIGPVGEFHDLVMSMAPGGVEAYFGHRQAQERRATRRPVLLRQGLAEGNLLYGEDARWVRSEALMRLDLGLGRRPGLLLFASEDPHRFSPDQGIDLLTFFGGVFERTMRRWLA
ncbi:MAG TPA: DUF484 family protein [Paracoccaceae bacterium]|nr:DUF484 family protein [Paracoccaceae bacterium]